MKIKIKVTIKYSYLKNIGNSYFIAPIDKDKMIKISGQLISKIVT